MHYETVPVALQIIRRMYAISVVNIFIYIAMATYFFIGLKTLNLKEILLFCFSLLKYKLHNHST